MNTNTGAYYEDQEVEKAKARGEPLVELPHKPEPNCGTCHGKGVKRSWGTEWKFGACPECYPKHDKKAKSFASHFAIQARSFRA